MWRESDGERQIVERSSLARATTIKHHARQQPYLQFMQSDLSLHPLHVTSNLHDPRACFTGSEDQQTETHRHYARFQPSAKQCFNAPSREIGNNAQTIGLSNLALGNPRESLSSNLIFVTTHYLMRPTSHAHALLRNPNPLQDTPPPFSTNRHRHCSGPLVSDWCSRPGELRKERQQYIQYLVRLRAAWSPVLSLRTIHSLQHKQ